MTYLSNISLIFKKFWDNVKVVCVPKVQVKPKKGAVMLSGGQKLMISRWFGKRIIVGRPRPPGEHTG